MEFLKRHYEKIILSVVLLGLAAVAAGLPIKVNQEKQKEEERKTSLLTPTIKKYPPVDLTTNEMVLAKVKSPIHFDISGKHNLFNPVTWIQRPNGELLKVKTGKDVGIGAVEVTAINDLKLIISFDGPIGDPKDLKYQITVTNQTASSPKSQRAFAKGGSNNLGTLKEVRGPEDNPTEVVFIPAGENAGIVLGKDKPFVRTIGYSADLVDRVSNTRYPGMRKGMSITVFNPETNGRDVYKIVAIDKDTVTFQASNKKPVRAKLERSPSEASTK
jgi:hypothetical protein